MAKNTDQKKQEDEPKKSETALREEEILAFWKENNVFKKSEAKNAPKGVYVFYDGPPFATGKPHYGTLLSSVIKDIIPRYKTMQGYRVKRRWGWDCHGLPIENMIEKELGLKSKKEIEEIGIDTFNRAARNAVLRFADEWKWYVDRIGRWVEFDNSYKTMNTTYIESVWWAIKNIHDKGLLYEGRKVLMYCPHCETPLAKAEIAMDHSYRDITEEAVTVMFHLKAGQKYGKGKETKDTVYMLAWTTTPWTLPGNVGLAVGSKVNYTALREKGVSELFIVASDLVENVFKDKEIEIVHDDIKGKDLVGLEYEPLYTIDAVANSGKKGWYVMDADFVTTEEGTGIVHTAVIYGEDDYTLGLKNDLPMVPLLSANGHFNTDAPKFIQDLYFKKSEKVIKEDLEKRKLLFSKHMYTHSYPHCYRCDTALIYNALSSWFIDIQKVKTRMVELNEKINWYPDHLKHGRFLHNIESAPDWTISRNRYWASPLPIWKNEKTGEVKIIGSIDELLKYTRRSGNTYRLMRHGLSEFNKIGKLNSDPKVHNPLASEGRENAKKSALELKEAHIDYIIYSPLLRTKETAEIVAKTLSLSKEKVIEDDRLREVEFGEFEGKHIDGYHSFFEYSQERLTKTPKGGEDWSVVKRRMTEVLYDLEEKHQNKNFLIVSHNGPLQMIQAGAYGYDADICATCIADDSLDFNNAEVRELPFIPLPHNEDHEVDLHRPYIDDVQLVEDDGTQLVRIPEVVDCWVESGSMPFASQHYPFENKEEFERTYPGNFIAEYIAQTRTWFYYMHAMATLLFDEESFTNVITTGNILGGDGNKMSKSKGNYTDPAENFNRFGADALRLYMLGSVVMQAEDVRFSDDELKDVHNRTINILANSFKFFALYKDDFDGATVVKDSENVLDHWIIANLRGLNTNVTKSLDAYDIVHACRSIREFVTDLSTWYIRRSRARFKEDAKDKQYALAVSRYVFIELAKVIAPITPFLAEDIYRKAGGNEESVHLDAWSNEKPLLKDEEQLLENMKSTRAVVTLALEARDKVGIKVRQPLQKLTIKDETLKGQDAYLELILAEVNVKQIIFDTAAESDVVLDTIITSDLKEEGEIRDFTRLAQSLRKKLGFNPKEKTIMHIVASANAQTLFKKYERELLNGITLKEIIYENDLKGGELLMFGEEEITVVIEPLQK